MMKRVKYILGLLLLAGALFSLSSCIDDDWYDDDWWNDGGWQDDRRVESVLRGRWFLDYVEMGYGDCPYYESDEFNFYSNGRFEIFGGEDFYERGKWYVEDRYIYFDIDRDGRTDMVAYIDELYRDFVSLDVKDYYENSRYYLELVR